ncbi:hypothetical protein HK100_005068 [Physocladia obscura]|uniref:Uncharacterized protein n=1 Tax=Physocladia obscura TaxID=109957 RepID=A0AAD5SUN5_9FUNG|nr:hypothetical protein HK100_005068 [Physocladia obscura]
MASNVTYPVQSTKPSAYFYIWISVNVPIAMIGAILNALIIMAILSDPAKTLQFRMDKIIFALSVTSLLFGLFYGAINLVTLCYNSAWLSSIQGAGESLLVVLLFALNMMLSVERFTFMRFPEKRRDGYMLAIVGFIAVLAVLVIFVFATSPSIDGLQPANQPQHTIWLVGLITALTISIFTIITVYTLAYLHVVKLIKECTSTNPMAVKQAKNSIKILENVRLWHDRTEMDLTR